MTYFAIFVVAWVIGFFCCVALPNIVNIRDFGDYKTVEYKNKWYKLIEIKEIK